MLEGDDHSARDDASAMDEGHEPHRRSLAEDIEALYEDGTTYVEAELAFQKTRARFVAGHAKRGTGYGLLALFLLHMAFIGLTVGAILTLIPLIGPLLSTLAVVGTLLLLVVILALLARGRFSRIGKAFDRGAK